MCKQWTLVLRTCGTPPSRHPSYRPRLFRGHPRACTRRGRKPSSGRHRTLDIHLTLTDCPAWTSLQQF